MMPRHLVLLGGNLDNKGPERETDRVRDRENSKVEGKSEANQLPEILPSDMALCSAGEEEECLNIITLRVSEYF